MGRDGQGSTERGIARTSSYMTLAKRDSASKLTMAAEEDLRTWSGEEGAKKTPEVRRCVTEPREMMGRRGASGLWDLGGL